MTCVRGGGCVFALEWVEGGVTEKTSLAGVLDICVAAHSPMWEYQKQRQLCGQLLQILSG